MTVRMLVPIVPFFLVSTAYANETIDEIVESVDAMRARVKDVTADFTQQKHTILLKKPLTSTGVVTIVESQMRWDTRKPRRVTMYADGKELWIYYPDQQKREIYKTSKKLARVTGAPFQRLATLREFFDLKRLKDDDAGRARIELSPKTDKLRDQIEVITLSVNLKTGFVEVVRTVDVEGDRTVITFANIKFNSDVDVKGVKPNIPDGTRTTIVD